MSFELTLPQLGLTMTEGIISEWLKKEGDEIAVGEVVFMVENDKSVVEYEAFQAGTIAKILVEEGVVVPIKTPVAVVAEAGEDLAEVAASVSEVTTSSSSSGPAEQAANNLAQPEPAQPDNRPEAKETVKSADGFTLASPRARALAEERCIDLTAVAGSGPDGVIIERDIPATGTATNFAVRHQNGLAAARADREISLNRIQAVAAERLTRAWQEIPQFTVYQDTSMNALQAWRNYLAEHAGYKPSMSVLIAKAVAAALLRHERLNAHWLGDNRLKVFGSAHIGIAMDTHDGLVVPVLRNCGTSSVAELNNQWKSLAERVKNGKATVDDYSGASFTVSNLGMFGTDRFRALINPPQVGILSVGAQKENLFQNYSATTFGNSRFTMGLTADHRAVDGAYAARFLNEVVIIIANPVLIYEAG